MKILLLGTLLAALTSINATGLFAPEDDSSAFITADTGNIYENEYEFEFGYGHGINCPSDGHGTFCRNYADINNDGICDNYGGYYHHGADAWHGHGHHDR